MGTNFGDIMPLGIVRAIFVVTAAFLAKLVFDYSYEEFQTVLPHNFDLTQVALTEPVNQVRKMYQEAFEHSILYSAATFAIVLFSLEFIRRGRFLRTNQYEKEFNSEMNRLQPIMDEIEELAKDSIPNEPKKQRRTEIDYSKTRLY